MPATGPGVLPASNVGGNNQTSPGVGGAVGAPTPVFTPVGGGGTLPSSNPYVSAAPTSTPAGSTGNALYSSQTSAGQGKTDISKQLQDMLGKGVGGSLNNILANLSGTDSAIFQQWLAAQVPANTAAEAQMRGGLGAMGVSGNSSVMGLAEANLGAQQSATAAQENANLMTQAINTSTGILQGTQNLAAKEVATTPLSIFGNVMGQLGSDAATLFSGTDLSKMFSHGGGGGGGGGAGTVPSGSGYGMASSIGDTG